MNLVERVKGIILDPSAEWRKIEPESGDAVYLFTNYVAILAAIPAITGLIGHLIIGTPFMFALITAIIGYVLAFVVTYLVALLVNALASTFGGRSDMPSALKVTVYSYTPAWVAGIFSIIPFLGIIGMLLGLYGIYLLYLGLPVLMKCPKDRAVLYTVAIVVCAIIISLVLGALIGLLFLRSLVMM